MIIVHRLNGKELAINADKIKFVEATPDTLLTLAVGDGVDERIMVQEAVDEVIKRVVDFKQRCLHPIVRSEQ